MVLPESADSWISLSQSVPCVVSTKEVLTLGLAIVSPLCFHAFLGSVVMVWSFALHWLSHISPFAQNPKSSFPAHSSIFYKSATCQVEDKKKMDFGHPSWGQVERKIHFFSFDRRRAYWHNRSGQHVFTSLFSPRHQNAAFGGILYCCLLTGLPTGSRGFTVTFLECSRRLEKQMWFLASAELCV